MLQLMRNLGLVRPSREVNLEVLQNLKCPVCRQYMVPPIRKCERNHTACDDCMTKYIRCGICYRPYLAERALELEELAAKQVYPCTYAGNGCTAILEPNEVTQHRIECEYRIFSCPFIEYEYHRCYWHGPKKGLKEHVTSCHSNKVIVMNIRNSATTWLDYLVVPDFLVFVAYGEVFVRRLLMRDHYFCGYALYVGPETLASKYSYTMKLERPDGFNKLKARHRVLSIHDDPDTYIDERLCLSLSENYTINFKDPNAQRYKFEFGIQKL